MNTPRMTEQEWAEHQRRVKNEYYPCKPDVFASSYDKEPA